jgi:hypothetical protein
MSAITSFLGFGPDTPEVAAAKEKVTAAEKELDAAKEAAKTAPASADSGISTAIPGGRRRKRKGGKHTKKHRKGGKGKTRKSRR